MLIIRKSLIAAAALALTPAFALAQTGGTMAKAPAAVSTTRSAQALSDASATTAKTKAAPSHKSVSKDGAKLLIVD